MIKHFNHILRQQVNKLAFLKAELSDLNLTLRTDQKNRPEPNTLFLSHTVTTGILFSKGKERSKTTLCCVHQIHDSSEKM